MTYVENTFICLAAPLLLAVLCLKKDWRRALIFLLSGMTSCLLSAYVSSYFTMVFKLDPVTASHEIVPAVEEIIKILPVLFYLLVFEPEKRMPSAALSWWRWASPPLKTSVSSRATAPPTCPGC